MYRCSFVARAAKNTVYNSEFFARAANGALSKPCPAGFKLQRPPSGLSLAGVPVMRIATTQGSCCKNAAGTMLLFSRSSRCFSMYAGRQSEPNVMYGQKKNKGVYGRQGVDPTETLWWVAGVLIMMFGGVWLTVPLYKMYCQAYGEGVATRNQHKEYAPPFDPNSEIGKKLITVDFQGAVHDTLAWDFVPQQRRLTVSPGETALAFYRAKNNTERPVIGVSVYHMIPPEAGLYFNKIQCFCFDEQLLNPNEEVDMPVLFFIDPEIVHDERFRDCDRISLQYIFFESDSDVPEEYHELHRAQKTQQAPQVRNAPAPTIGLKVS